LAPQQYVFANGEWLLHGVLLQASVTSLRNEWQAELAGLKSELDHRRRQAAAALKAKQEEEDFKVRGRVAAHEYAFSSAWQSNTRMY
jgi:aspartate/tyrosine/aromatic aminotransferase